MIRIGERTEEKLPVTGASISIIVFSDLSRAAPSCMIRKAAASSIRPSSIKCCLSTSDWGLPVRASNTSATVNLWLGGKGTPGFWGKREEKKQRKIEIRFHQFNTTQRRNHIYIYEYEHVRWMHLLSMARSVVEGFFSVACWSCVCCGCCWFVDDDVVVLPVVLVADALVLECCWFEDIFNAIYSLSSSLSHTIWH